MKTDCFVLKIICWRIEKIPSGFRKCFG